MSEMPEKIEVTAEIATTEEAEVLDVSMTGEEATAIRALLLQGLATTDTEAHLQRAEELTDTSQVDETTLPPAAADRPPTTAHATDRLPHPDAAVATPPAFLALPRRHASLADVATTGPHPEMPTTAKITAKASAVTKAADPVRVLLLTSVAHDHPDVTATTAAEDRPPTIADHLPRRSAAAEPHPLCLDHHHADDATPQARGRVHARLRGAVRGGLTRRPHAPTSATSVGLAQVMPAKAAAPAAISHLLKKTVRWIRRRKNNTRKVTTTRHGRVSQQHKEQRALP